MEQTAERLLECRTLDSVAQVRALQRIDPSWGTRISQVADGWLLLSGQGMYLNRAMSLGLKAEPSDNDIQVVISESQSMGLEPLVEVTRFTSPSLRHRLVEHGFVHDRTADVSAMARPVSGPPRVDDHHIVIRSVVTEDDLELWQKTAAAGWERPDPKERAASDAFARAAHTTDGEGMMIAFDIEDNQPVGTASMTIRDRVATLGGMSTVPAHRRRGVQAGFVSARLKRAADLGCDLATTTAASGSPSERNLQRLGFEPVVTIQMWRG